MTETHGQQVQMTSVGTDQVKEHREEPESPRTSKLAPSQRLANTATSACLIQVRQLSIHQTREERHLLVEYRWLLTVENLQIPLRKATTLKKCHSDMLRRRETRHRNKIPKRGKTSAWVRTGASQIQDAITK